MEREVFNNLSFCLLDSLTSLRLPRKDYSTTNANLFLKYPTPQALSMAKYEEVYEIIQSLGFAKMKAKNLIAMANRLHTVYKDEVPKTLEELQTLNGVGRKTASVILAEGYKIPAMPVDTHLERMAKRFGYTDDTATVVEAEAAYRKYIPEEEWIEAHHLLLLFGRYYCKALHPACDSCTLKNIVI